MPNAPRPDNVAHTVRVSRDLWLRAKQRADERGETVSGAVRRFLERYTREKMSEERTAEKDAGMAKRPDESQTEFTVRCIQAEAWEKGYRSGFSNAMRRMSDEPDVPTTPNPYRVAPPGQRPGFDFRGRPIQPTEKR